MSLLLLRSKPVIGSTQSTAELLYGRKLANPLPVTYPVEPSHENTLSSNVSTARHYDKNKSHRYLSDIEPLTNVHYRDYVSNTWKPAVVTSQRQEPRSYDILTNYGSTLRRNHRDILPATPLTLGPDVDIPLRDV